MSLRFWVKKPPKEDHPEVSHAKDLEAHVDRMTEDAVCARKDAEHNIGRIIIQLEKNHLGPLMRKSLEPRI